MGQTTIDSYAQLFFDCLLELATKYSFTVFRYEEIGILVTFKGFCDEGSLADSPASHQHSECCTITNSLLFVLMQDRNFCITVIELHKCKSRFI